MAARRALIVGEALGPGEEPVAVLARFGFAPPVTVRAMRDGIENLRTEHYDLVVVPLGDATAQHLYDLDHQARRGAPTVVIGTASEPDPELMLRAFRAGVHEFVVSPADPGELSAAIERLLRRARGDGAPGRLIAVYSGKGGLGCTTIAVNVADSLAKGDPAKRVALADLAVAGGDVGVFLNVASPYTLADLVQKIDRMDADLLNSLMTPLEHGPWVIPSADDPELDDTLRAPTVTSIVEQFRSHFAFTVLDCEHHLGDRTLAALDAADRVVLVTQLTIPALRSTQRTLALFRRLGYGDEKVCVVVNRRQAGDVLTIADATKTLGVEPVEALPNDYQLCSAALTRGVAVSEQEAESKLAGAFARLAVALGGSPIVAGAHGGRNGGGSPLGRLLGRMKRS